MDEKFRYAMYDACRQMGLAIVPKGVAARVFAYVGLQGGDERIAICPRLICEIQHIQKLYRVEGGEMPDKDFVELVQEYTVELKNYTDNHNGKWPEWLTDMIYKRYGFKPYNL